MARSINVMCWCSVLMRCVNAVPVCWCSVLMKCVNAVCWCGVLMQCVDAVCWCSVDDIRNIKVTIEQTYGPTDKALILHLNGPVWILSLLLWLIMMVIFTLLYGYNIWLANHLVTSCVHIILWQMEQVQFCYLWCWAELLDSYRDMILIT